MSMVSRLDWEEEINSIAEMGRSQGVLVETAKAFDALRGWEEPPAWRVGEMALALETVVEVVPVQETSIINILVRDADADTSIIIADLYGDAFLREFRRVSQISQSTEYFQNALGAVEENIQQARNSKASLQEEMNLYDWNHEQIASADVAKHYRREQQRAEMNRILFEREVDLEMGFFEDPENFILTQPLREDQIILKLENELMEAELELAELASRYQPGHRLVIAKTAEFEALKGQFATIIEKTINEHVVRLDQLITREKMFAEAALEAEQRLENVPSHAAQLEYYDAYIHAQWLLYRDLNSKFSDVRASEEQSLIENRIVKLGPPNIGGVEGVLPKVVIYVVAPLFALLLAMAIAFMKEATTHTFQKPVELEEYTGLPVLASFRKL